MPPSARLSTLFPYTTLFRSAGKFAARRMVELVSPAARCGSADARNKMKQNRSEEHTSELQSLRHLVCRLPHGYLHSFPTRRSSDLLENLPRGGWLNWFRRRPAADPPTPEIK